MKDISTRSTLVKFDDKSSEMKKRQMFVVFVVSIRIFLIFHHFNDLNLVLGITKGSV
jgi:hypothetical protein